MSAEEITVETQRFIRCPECGKGVNVVEHLLPLAQKESQGDPHRPYVVGPWFCQLCGYGFELDVYAAGRVLTRPARNLERTYAEYALLEIPPHDSSVWLIVEGQRHEPHITDDHRDYCRFKYEENSSPANVFTDVQRATFMTPFRFHAVFGSLAEAEARLDEIETE